MFRDSVVYRGMEVMSYGTMFMERLENVSYGLVYRTLAMLVWQSFVHTALEYQSGFLPNLNLY